MVGQVHRQAAQIGAELVQQVRAGVGRVIAEPGSIKHSDQERHPGQAGDVEVAESRLQPAARQRSSELLRDRLRQSHFTVRNL